MLQETLRYTFAGAGPEVRQKLAAFAAATGADEVIVSSAIHDPAARRSCFERLAPAS